MIVSQLAIKLFKISNIYSENVKHDLTSHGKSKLLHLKDIVIWRTDFHLPGWSVQKWQTWNGGIVRQWVLGQLPTGDNSPSDKNKAQLLPTRATIPRTTPHLDNSPPDHRPISSGKNHSSGPISTWWGAQAYGTSSFWDGTHASGPFCPNHESTARIPASAKNFAERRGGGGGGGGLVHFCSNLPKTCPNCVRILPEFLHRQFGGGGRGAVPSLPPPPPPVSYAYGGELSGRIRRQWYDWLANLHTAGTIHSNVSWTCTQLKDT